MGLSMLTPAGLLGKNASFFLLIPLFFSSVLILDYVKFLSSLKYDMGFFHQGGHSYLDKEENRVPCYKFILHYCCRRNP